ncbi:RING zinc finger-containing protein [Tieghemostelium lacteum]|uniref:RING zinc finger-containing protein n=1 Tax=Tieghemostelium lacteum TaxID=361077 RepID=A0A151ZE74_TIELA|nr:RING zinc finger-containing protein [Tieghemostelium lacteum]|eukprot:KYQ92219.1 RING zinc finger-containing protein [Tieghemostelium lacteum]
MEQDGNKCIDNVHIKDCDLFCKSCFTLVCGKCFKDHKGHEITDIDDIVKLLTTNNALQLEIDELEKRKLLEKETNDLIFQTKIKEIYDSQLSQLTNQFRTLHDDLHIKEIELKRELKSYFEDNSEMYYTTISMIENELENSSQIKSFFNSSNMDKLKLMELYQQFKKSLSKGVEPSSVISTDTLVDSKYYHQSLLPKFEEISKQMSVLALKSYRSTRLKPMYNEIPQPERNVLYRFNQKSGLERYCLKTGNCDILIPHTAQFSPVHNSSYLLFQRVMIDQVIYLFYRNKSYILDLKEKDLEWVSREFNIKVSVAKPESLYCYSSIYDGKDHIYIIGGYAHTSVGNILRFNIRTREMQELGTKLLVPSDTHSLTLDGDFIYIIGGYNTDSHLNRIDRLDLRDHSIVNIAILADIKNFHAGACYVPKEGVFYLLSVYEPIFFKYDPNTKKTTPLEKPTKTNYCSILQYDDNADLLYLYRNGSPFIEVYNIENNLWSQLDLKLSEPTIHSDDYFYLNNI